MAKAAPKLERPTFITSRQLEYFSKEELEKQIAYPINYWPLAITKELIDNGLDACEAIPVPPLITVTVEGDRITVADNAGAGLAVTTLMRSQDYAVTISNKAHYSSPLRGRQGNALKTVWAAPFVFNGGCEGDGKGRIEVVTPSYAVEVSAYVNRIKQEPDLKTTALKRPFVRTGTVVTIDWIRESRYLEDEIPDFYKTVLDLLQSYALFNPHAGFRLSCNGETVDIGTPIIEAFEKWLPSDLTPPHWYSVETLSNLIGAHLTNGSGQKTVREFVSHFAGLTSPPKQKRVLEAAGLERQRLNNLVMNDETEIDGAAVERLLTAMCAESKMVKAAKLGVIGEEALTQRLIEIEGVNRESVRYAKAFEEGAEPAVMEVVWGIREPRDLPAEIQEEDAEFDQADGRRLRYGLNFAPTVGNRCPLGAVPQVLHKQMVESRDPVCMVLHAVSPHFRFADKGKSMLTTGGDA